MYRVYIDESGDRGMKAESSEYFVVAAVIVKDRHTADLRADLANIRKVIGRPVGQVLHFRKMAHEAKVKVTQEMAQSHLAAITSVIMCKRLISNPAAPGGAAYISVPDPMYLYSLRMLWERVSWFVRDDGRRDGIRNAATKVTFAQIKHFHIKKILDYRAKLETRQTHMHWPSFAGHPFTMRGMDEVELLQLADSAASGIAARGRTEQVRERRGSLPPKPLTEAVQVRKVAAYDVRTAGLSSRSR
jgi:Protein of unknown function (DUF3800)